MKDRKKFLGLPLLFWAVIGTAGVALAVIGFWVTLQVTGSITVTDAGVIDVVFDEVTPVTLEGTGGCTGTVDSATSFGISAAALAPNDDCVFRVNAINTGDVDAYFYGFGANWGGQGFDNMDVRANFGECLTWNSGEWWDGNPQSCTSWATADNYCGTVIPAGGTTTEVGFRFQISQYAVPGSTYTFNPGGGGGDGFMFGTITPESWECQ